MDLRRHNRPIASVLDLAGTGEVAVTGALGWALATSQALLDAFLADFGLPQGSVSQIRIEQHDEAVGGRTDIELVGDDLLVVVEGKAGSVVPGPGRAAAHDRASIVPDIGYISPDTGLQWAGHLDLILQRSATSPSMPTAPGRPVGLGSPPVLLLSKSHSLPWRAKPRPVQPIPGRRISHPCSNMPTCCM